jgi:putative PEP-CTERM system histidine kinase
MTLTSAWLLIAEIARNGTWIHALLSSLRFTAGSGLALRFRLTLEGLWLAMLGGAVTLAVLGHPLAGQAGTIAWAGLLLTITGLIAVEQLYRNTQHYRLIKLLSITIGAIFVYDIYLFSHSLIFNRIDTEPWQARGGINTLAALMTALGALVITHQEGQHARLAISRPIVFYSASLTAAGSFLALMAVAGYYMRLYGGSWGNAFQIMLLFAALMAISVVFISRTARSRLNVWINKHFFRHKYDYRVEWLKLINSLSRPSPDENFHERAIKAVSTIFKSPGGALWLRKESVYAPVRTYHMPLPEAVEEPVDTPFCHSLSESEWVFSPNSPENDRLSTLNQLLPGWIYTIDKLWLVIPLLTETELLGFMVLTEPDIDASLTWEDLDLAKTVGRQIASYLDRHDAAELLAQSRQFEAFNKFTAFIMHDLKNLIAQQALVVENAARHRDNPAFFEDAIHTIENSVARMSNLLRKLQQNEPSELRSVELHRTLMDAVKKCKEQRPVPSLRLEQTDIRVNADQDRLTMTLVHLIRNAQEATDNNGFVDITMGRRDNTALIVIEDNGVGMSREFIHNQLFKPFVTTKSGKGMGIGAYQTREFITSLGGAITVESTPGEGATFTITLPLANS